MAVVPLSRRLAWFAADLLLPIAEWLSRPRRRLPGAWRPGVSIVIPERGSPRMLKACLAAAQAAAHQTPEPVEILVVVNGTPLVAYTEVAEDFPKVRWLHSERPLSFAAAVRLGVRSARHDWVYLLNNDVTLEPDALAQLLPWRAPHVFAIASQIFFADPSRRREETGWTDFRCDNGQVEIFDAIPEDQETVRGSLYAGGGASLFRAPLLRRYMTRKDPYSPFYWEDVEWGVRAWRSGYEVLFCPKSRVYHRHRATISRFYEEREIDRIFRRNQLQFALRNRFGPGGMVKLGMADPETQAEILSWLNWLRLLLARVRAKACTYPDFCFTHVRRKFYPTPFQSPPDGPTILVVAPYAILPPAHGGAIRLVRMLERLKRELRIVLLTDEEDRYSTSSVSYMAGLHAVHLVGGRPEMRGSNGGRIGRILNHSHKVLSREASRLAATYAAAAVQVEFVELAKLIDARASGTPWFLTLHDVLLSPAGRSAEDVFENRWIGRYDALVACSPEDRALLRHRDVIVAPNGVDLHRGAYVPSRGRRGLLFLGPFRYAPNWEGIQRFLLDVYPNLRSAVPDVSLDILGGHGGPDRAGAVECFRQSGVRVHDYVENVRPWLDACAVTINPLPATRGSCLKVIESLAAGRVCVSTIEGARGFVHEGFRSLVAVPGIENFIEPLARLLSDETYRLSIESPDWGLLQHYTWDESAQRQLDLYRRHLDAKRQ